MRTMRILPTVLGLMVLWVLTMPVQAEVYKWRGPDGVVRYGQLPPPGVQAQAIGETSPEPGVEDAVTNAEPRSAEQDQAELEQIRAEQAEREAKRKAEREEYCVQARAELQKLDERPSSRLARRGEDGEQIRMTQAEYDAHRAQVQAGIDEYCN